MKAGNLAGLGGVGASAVPDSTSGSGAPSASKPNGSTYLQTNVTPNVLFIRVGGSWVNTNVNSDTDTTDYNALANLPTIPNNTNQLTNGAGYTTFSGSYVDLSNLPTLFNGNYLNLSNLPTIPGAGDFNITDLAGFSNDAYANASLGWGNISLTSGANPTTWGFASAYTPSGTTQTLTLAIVHPSFGTSSVTGTWTRSGTAVISGFALSSASGASGSGNNTWTFGDVNSDSGSSDNSFGSNTASYGTKVIFVQHSASNKIFQVSAAVLNTNFSVKCLTPAMLPKNLQIGDEVDSPQGKTKVTDIQYKEREGYYILENELEITNDHPILIDGEWILAEEYAGKKEYIDEATEVVYVETENELLTVKDWTVGGKY